MFLFSIVGKRSRVSLSQRAGLSPLAFAVASNDIMTAVRLPADSDPMNSQFFLPNAMGRMAFSAGSLADQ
jgi:hypothetical protein